MAQGASGTFEGCDEGLTPTLDERNDQRGFLEPWNPRTLVFLAFFLGAWPGGWLVADNFRRLGQRQRFVPWLLAFAALGAAVFVTSLCLYEVRGPAARSEHMSLLAVGHRALSALLAMVAAAQQKERWRVFDMSDRKPGRLWPSALAAVGVSLLVTLGAVGAWIVLSG